MAASFILPMDMRIVFMGTPDFAVPSLAALLGVGHEIVAVVTAPDRPAGRGRQPRPSAVKQFAVENNLKVLQPEKLKDPDFLQELKDLNPELAVVVAFRMLPEAVWSIPSIGTFNLHASMLPDYRGSAPINWVIMNGETETGLTTFFIDKKIDTGNILLQQPVTIPGHWTAGDLHDVMMEMGADLVVETARQIESGEVEGKPQDHSKYKNPAPKIFPEDCRVDWTRTTRELYNHVRGLSPYPAAWTTLEGKKVKLFLSELVVNSVIDAPAGSILTNGKNALLVRCGDGMLKITEIQIEGKKRMDISSFLAGYKDPLIKFE